DAIIGMSLDGVVEQWNGGAERMFGYPAEEVVGHPLDLLMPPEERAHIEACRARIRRGAPAPMWEAAWLRQDGSRVDVSVTISPVRDGSGNVVRLASILRDVSERKRMQAQLIQAERLASVGTLAAGVAHEINNPLAYVIANLAFVADELRTLHG